MRAVDDLSFAVRSRARGIGGGRHGRRASFPASLAALVAWAAVFIAVGLLVDRRRDVE